VKTVQLYMRRGVVFIQTQSRTVDGAWIATPLLFTTTIDDPSSIGRSVLNALDCSVNNVPHPTDFKKLVTPLLEAAGVKSWSRFVQGTRSVLITLDGRSLCALPYSRDTETSSFVGSDSDRVYREATPDVMAIGEWLQGVIETAE